MCGLENLLMWYDGGGEIENNVSSVTRNDANFHQADFGVLDDVLLFVGWVFIRIWVRFGFVSTHIVLQFSHHRSTFFAFPPLLDSSDRMIS